MIRMLRPLALFVLLGAAAASAASPDMNAVDAAGATPLLRAVYDGDAARVDALLKAGVDPRRPNVFGATPMGEAARRGEATGAVEGNYERSRGGVGD